MASDLSSCEPPPCAGAFFSSPSLTLDLVAQLCELEPRKALSRVSLASRRAALAACSSLELHSRVPLSTQLACAAVFREHGAHLRSLHIEPARWSSDREQNARSNAAALALPRLAAIETLNFSKCEHEATPDDMAALSALKGLRELYLCDMVLPDTGCLAALRHLEVLRLSSASVDPRLRDTLGHLRCLTRLHLHDMRLEGGGKGRLDATPLLARAASLRALSISPGGESHRNKVRVMNECAVKLMRFLLGLKFLSLEKCRISPIGACRLAGWVSLEHLELFGDRIGDAGAAALTSMTALTKLDLHDNNIGTPAVKALACLTNLVSLDVGRNRLIDDEGAKALARMTHLTALD
ncbi:hypothetical protein MNEG_4214, partial [Monoraphidium neglectum]